MKIGIVTFQRADNQGALLQCYALYSFLKKTESDTEVIDYRNNNIEKFYKIFPVYKNPKRIIKKWTRGICKYKELKNRHNNFEKLRNKIKFSESLSFNKLKTKENNYDLIITGSDQVFNTKITNGLDDIYYLNFPGSYIKCGYAVSMGSTDNPAYEKEDFRKLVCDFDFLSMREKDAVDFISDITSKPVVQCLDPTLLLNRNEWEKITQEAEMKAPEKYILLYYVQTNPELNKIAEKISKEKNIPVIYFEENVQLDCEKILMLSAGPMEFVQLIRNADTIVTSSFHATVFSCIFEKNVHIIAHTVTGSRVVSLCDIFDIGHRIYSDYADFESKYNAEDRLEYNLIKFNKQYEQSVNYINEIISAARRKSDE